MTRWDHEQPANAPDQMAGADPAMAIAWDLRLYVAGQTDKSIRAINNLTRICQEHLEGRYSIEVIDLVERPKLAADDHILALPTLVRRLPEPIRKIIGDLSNEERVLIGLDVRRRAEARAFADRWPGYEMTLSWRAPRGGRCAPWTTCASFATRNSPATTTLRWSISIASRNRRIWRRSSPRQLYCATPGPVSPDHRRHVGS